VNSANKPYGFTAQSIFYGLAVYGIWKAASEFSILLTVLRLCYTPSDSRDYLAICARYLLFLGAWYLYVRVGFEFVLLILKFFRKPSFLPRPLSLRLQNFFRLERLTLMYLPFVLIVAVWNCNLCTSPKTAVGSTGSCIPIVGLPTFGLGIAFYVIGSLRANGSLRWPWQFWLNKDS
jgi:hypothetical protein